MSGSSPSNATFANGMGVVLDSQLNSFVQTTSTISTLRSFTAVAGQVCLTTGAVAPGDGSGAFYYFSLGNYTDNGSTVIVPYASVGSGGWLIIPLSNSG
jgi:hypothetical protein